MKSQQEEIDLNELSDQMDKLTSTTSFNHYRNSEDVQHPYAERLNLLEELTRKLDQNFTALDSYVRHLGSSVVDLYNQKTIFGEAFYSLSQKVESLKKKELSEDEQGKPGIVNLDSSQDEVKIAELEKKVTELISKETQMENQIVGLKDEVKELRTQNAQMQEEILKLRSEMDNFRAEMQEQFSDNLRAQKNQSLEDGQADNRNKGGFAVKNIGKALFEMLNGNNSSEPSVSVKLAKVHSLNSPEDLEHLEYRHEVTL